LALIREAVRFRKENRLDRREAEGPDEPVSTH
jgi:hypothetical protein